MDLIIRDAKTRVDRNDGRNKVTNYAPITLILTDVDEVMAIMRRHPSSSDVAPSSPVGSPAGAPPDAGEDDGAAVAPPSPVVERDGAPTGSPLASQPTEHVQAPRKAVVSRLPVGRLAAHTTKKAEAPTALPAADAS